MAFTREQLEAYEKQPQKPIDDKVNPFRGATPAQAADAAAVAAVAAGQTDATPGGTPAAAAAPAVVSDDDSPVVIDEDGNLGDPTVSGEGTSDEHADPSTASADPSGEPDPNTDLTGEPAAVEEAPTQPAPKKGSAAERIVELADLMEGYKVFGKHMQDQLVEANRELARLRGGGTAAPSAPAPAVAPPAAEVDEPMPDMSDADVAFDNDKYRAKMAKWTKAQAAAAARAAVREVTGVDAAKKLEVEVDNKIKAFEKEHPDFKAVVNDNPVLASNQLAPDAGRIVAESEHTAELLYRFGKDAGLAIRVARQSPAQQLVTIGRMIAEIESSKKGGPAPQSGAKPGKQKSITQAPPPPRPTPAAGRPTARDVTDPAMDMDEFARRHRESKQQGRAQARKLRGLN
jgi:hypothetical protein